MGMTQHSTGLPLKAERTFLEDTAVDRLMAMVMTLAAEPHLTRDRLSTLEKLMESGQPATREALDSFHPDFAQKVALDAAPKRFGDALMFSRSGSKHRLARPKRAWASSTSSEPIVRPGRCRPPPPPIRKAATFDTMPVRRPFDACQAFVLDCKLSWTRTMFFELRKRYELAAEADKPKGPENVAQILKTDTAAQVFGWFERHLRRMKYLGQQGLAVHFDQYRDQIVKDLAAATSDDRPTVNPEFEQPEYNASIDIDLRPGGVWSDEIAGYIYECKAPSVAPILKKFQRFVRRMTAQALERAGRDVKKVVDLGCGWGGSTQPKYEDHPEIDVTGVKLSAPCLRVAAMRDDPFKEWLHNGHSVRNNEPFMVPLNAIDIDEARRATGFDDAEIVPFEEFDGSLSLENTAWRFPWTMIVARKAA